MAGNERFREGLEEEEGARGGVRGGALVSGEEEEELPGPRLGSGPVWRLPAGRGASEAERDGEDGALFRCGALLEQALSCSPYADVRFVFDDGNSGVSGHRGMLCGVSGEFRGMFESGMVEAKSREVRVRGVGRASFRGFLEYIYLGRAGREMGLADGREVWMLADLYDVQGVKDWLLEYGLAQGGVCAAAQFALEGGGLLDELFAHCVMYACNKGLNRVTIDSLRGVSAEAAAVVLGRFHWGEEVGKVVNAMMMQKFQCIDRWARANGGLCYGNDDVADLLGLIDFEEICPRDLMDIVRPSGLLREGNAEAMYEKRVRGGKLERRSLGIVRVLDTPTVAFDESIDRGLTCCAFSSQCGDQRVALSDSIRKHVIVFDCVSGAFIMAVGHEQLGTPQGLAFDDQGQLLVCDRLAGRVCAFDSSGAFVREMGRSGPTSEGLRMPEDVAVSTEGHVIVTDTSNDRVVVYRADGTFVRSIGSFGEADGEFMRPRSVACGADGRIIVLDALNCRVQVFSADGDHVMTFGSSGVELGQFIQPLCVALNTHGEIVVSDVDRKDIQLFSKHGELLQRFGECDFIGVPRAFIHGGVCFDSKGYLVVSNERKRHLSMQNAFGELLILA